MRIVVMRILVGVIIVVGIVAMMRGLVHGVTGSVLLPA